MRVWRSLALGLGLLLPAACGDSTSVDLPPLEIRLQQVFGSTAGLSSPIDLQAPPGDSRFFIAERPGRIRVVQGGVLLATAFLDISSRVTVQGEAGLLSFAFDPQFSFTCISSRTYPAQPETSSSSATESRRIPTCSMFRASNR